MYFSYTCSAVHSTEGTQPQTALLRDCGKGGRFFFRALLGTWIFLSQQALPTIIPLLLQFAVTYGLLSCTLYFFLFIYIPVVSSEHFALQALGICRSCYEILQSERKKRSLLPQAVQNASKHAQNTANSSLTVTTVVLLSQYQT